MEETTNKFIIDTKKFCFMCLHNGNNGRPGPASITAAATTRFSFSMKGLTRFLKVDLQKVFNINMTPSNSSRNLLDETDILVSLCKVCFMEATKFDQLYQELKQIERRVKCAVRTLHQLMAAGESNPVLVESFNQRMKSTNPFELIQKSITENFRKETIEKLYFSGSSKAGALVVAGASNNNNQTNRPGSSGSGFNGVHQSQSRSHLTTPSLMARRPHPQLEGPSQQALARGPPLAGSRIKMKRPLIIRGGGGGVSAKVPPPPALSRLKPPVPPLRRVIPATSSNNSSVEPRPKKMSKQEVPCVDLDSDPEENSPDLVINSVSSVNGITITYPGGSTSTSTLSDYQQQLQNSRFNELEITPCSSASVTSYGNGGLGFGTTHATMSSAAGSYYGMTQNPNSNLDFDTTNLLEEAQRQQISNSAKVFIQCIHCQQKFTTNSGLRNHILAVHRAELFAQFKKPEKTPEEFKEALDKVFFEYGERNGDVNCWPCLFCEKRLGYKHTAEAHMIQSHFDNISEMLVAWQDGAISLTPEQIFKLGQSRGNVSSSGLSGAASCDAILQEALNGSGPSSTNDFTPATVTPVPEVTVSSVPSTSAGVTIKLENDSSPFKCKICDKGFNDAVSLEGHTLIKHSTDTSALASTATYSCAHCQKRFSYYHVQRVHVFTRHRTEELSKHLPKDTPVDEIEPALTPILNNYVKLETGKKYGCPFSPCTREFSHTEYTMLQNHVWLCHFEELLTRLKAAISERMGKSKNVIKTEVKVGVADTQVEGQEDKGLSQAQVKTEIQTEVREGKVQSQTQAQVKTEPEAGETGESNSSKRVKTEPLEPVEPLTNANAINSSTPSHSHPHRVTKIETEAIDPEPVVDSMLEILPDLE